MRIEDRWASGTQMVRFENGAHCSLGAAANIERDLALDCFIKSGYLHSDSLRMVN